MARAVRYDIESFLDELGDILKAGLNNKITAINEEKNDSAAMKTVDPQAFAFQRITGKVENFNPFVVYGLEDTPSVAVTGGVAAKTYVCSVAVVLKDDPTDEDMARRHMRYARAIEETIGDNWKNRNASSLEVKRFTPVKLKDKYFVTGVFIEVTIV